MSELMTVIDALATLDVHHVAEPVLLTETETLIQARDRIDGLLARSLQAMDVREVSINECGRHLKAWLIEDQHLDPKDAARRTWVARRLPYYPQVEAAMLAGDINHDHARVIIGCLLKLPSDWKDAAEAELLEFARSNDPGMLGALCRELRVRTGADEDAEAAAQRRYDDRWVTLSSTIDGMTSIQGMLDPESAATLNAALAPLLVPTVEDDRTAAQRRADALTELAALAMRHGGLPDHGGERPQITALIPYDQLYGKLTGNQPGQPGQLGQATINGQPVTPATIRRLACDANIIPAVLGSHSEVLNLGRSTPTWNRAQRRARRITDQGCTWPGCQTPLTRCHIHHLDHHAHGGPTDLNNGAHICRFHHWLVHHKNWTIWRDTQATIHVRRT